MPSRLFSALFVFFVAVALSAHADSVFVKGIAKPMIGEVKAEDAKGITLQKGKTVEFVPAADIIDVHYEDVKPTSLRLGAGEYTVAKAKEKEANEATDPAKQKTALAAAIKNYETTLVKMDPHKYAVRTIRYKIAILMLRQAQNDKLPTTAAVAKMQEFKTSYPESWEINHVMPLIAQTQLDAGDFKGASATFAEMAGMDTLPADVRTNAELMTVQVAVRSGDVKSAQKKLDALEKKSAGNPKLQSRIRMIRAEVLVNDKKIDQAVPLLHQVIRESNDKDTRALAHNTLGECLYKANRFNEAKWEFLWVDTIYNQDRHEHAKALYYLVQTFNQLGDADRAQECRALLESTQFAGTQWQQELLKKTK